MSAAINYRICNSARMNQPAGPENCAEDKRRAAELRLRRDDFPLSTFSRVLICLAIARHDLRAKRQHSNTRPVRSRSA